MNFSEIEKSVKQFCKDTPYKTNVLVMMRYRDQEYFKEIESTIRDVLGSYGMKARFAKDKAYSDDLWENIKIYLHGCKYGIVVFEEIDEREYNPNVSLELGYMYALGKRCLLLKEKRMKRLPTDVCGKLYKDFDQFHIGKSIHERIEEWLEKDLGITKKLAHAKIEFYLQELKYGDSKTRASAAEVLENIGSEKAIGPLTEALKDGDSGVRASAASALGKIGDEKLIDVLIELFKDEDSGVRASAAGALGNIGSEKAIGILTEALKDGDSISQWLARAALEKITDEELTKKGVKSAFDS